MNSPVLRARGARGLAPAAPRVAATAVLRGGGGSPDREAR